LDNRAVASGVRIRVAVCLVDSGRVLLVQHEKEGHWYWLLPGGGVEPGETMQHAAGRELEEETGFRCEVGRLLIVCEAIEPRGRHIVNMVFAGRLTGGTRRVGEDRVLTDVRWVDEDVLETLEFYPPIAADLAACLRENLDGPLRFLGNVWVDRAPADA
jgi:acetyl-CoA carboxylase carboxyl transferase subunit beta